MTFISGLSEPEHSLTTSKYLAGDSFIITPPFSPSEIWLTSDATNLLSSFRQQIRGHSLRNKTVRLCYRPRSQNSVHFGAFGFQLAQG